MPGFLLHSLPDGRRVAVTEFGAPHGMPVFYQHGFPGSRLEAALVAAEAAGLGLRLIALDRPGIGQSDYLPGRSFADWPGDVAAVADALGIDRFGLLGVSGGGPYALACRSLLGARVLATGIVCGLGPLAGTDLLADMEWPARVSFSAIAAYPRITQPIFRRALGPFLHRWPGLALRLLNVSAPRADRRVLRRTDVHGMLEQAIAEAFQGGVEGVVHELWLYTRNWEFPLAQGHGSILFWHGLADATVPISHSHYLARRFPGADMTPFAEEGHFSLPVIHGAAILSDLKDAMEVPDANH